MDGDDNGNDDDSSLQAALLTDNYHWLIYLALPHFARPACSWPGQVQAARQLQARLWLQPASGGSGVV